MTVSSTPFETAFNWVVGVEGDYTNDPGDPGNWTGGAVGSGQCNGTKYGISAASYPTLDIANLTEAEAEAIYQRDYWTPIQGDSLPQALALVIFDAAVNSGVSQSVQWLQVVIGATTDGNLGPETLAAMNGWTGGADSLCSEVLAQRIAALGDDSNWNTFGLGWSRRCAALAFQAATLL
ncbi:MAG TPA: glycosyl hydrolase 108 family protein [Acetobacteraceae bacterium]|nr:glycosyl hydrolase 108 family protein [Acetobacteraceae bacterium]